jgi:hypothetical protein
VHPGPAASDPPRPDTPPSVMPLRTWLTARWIASLIAAVIAGAAAVPAGQGAAVLGVATLAFFVSGAAGWLRGTRWGARAGGIDAPPPQLARVPRLRPLLPPVATASVLAAAELTDRPYRWGAVAALVAMICAGLAGLELWEAATVNGWERRTGRRLVRPAGARPFLGRRSVLAHGAGVDAGRAGLRQRALPVVLVAGIAIGLAQLAALAATPSAAATTGANPTLSRVATSLAGYPAHVTCWSAGALRAYERRSHQNVAGITLLDRIDLAPNVCSWLDWLHRTGAWPSTAQQRLELAEAGGVLAHESGHVRFGSDETTAECFAYGHVARALSELGLDPGHARALQRLYDVDLHPRLPARYLRRACT